MGQYYSGRPRRNHFMSVDEHLFQLRMIIRSLHQEVQKCEKNYKACLTKAHKTHLETEIDFHINHACDHYVNMLEYMGIISNIEQKIVTLENMSRSTIVNDLLVLCTQDMDAARLQQPDLDKLAMFQFNNNNITDDMNKPIIKEKIKREFKEHIQNQKDHTFRVENLPIAPIF